MKKWQKNMLIIGVWYIITDILYITVLTKISTEMKAIKVFFILFMVPLVIYFLSITIYKIIKFFIQQKVLQNSLKIKEINKLFERYTFETIVNSKRKLAEREYSRKSLDRIRGRDVLYYHLDHNIDGILEDVEKAIANKEKYDDFVAKAKQISIETPDEIIRQTGYKKEKFQKIENELINKIFSNKSYYDMEISLNIFYRSNQGNVNDSRICKIDFSMLCELYNEWLNKKAYASTVKSERKIMNDDIRFNVLARDKYTCQICGATAKDGAKLHVDHIIPVSKGGKTIMTNLQTLCERCNIGKSNKLEEDLPNNTICPQCGGKLVKREGKYGPFFGCSNYPKCRYIKKIKEESQTAPIEPA